MMQLHQAGGGSGRAGTSRRSRSKPSPTQQSNVTVTSAPVHAPDAPLTAVQKRRAIGTVKNVDRGPSSVSEAAHAVRMGTNENVHVHAPMQQVDPAPAQSKPKPKPKQSKARATQPSTRTASASAPEADAFTISVATAAPAAPMQAQATKGGPSRKSRPGSRTTPAAPAAAPAAAAEAPPSAAAPTSHTTSASGMPGAGRAAGSHQTNMGQVPCSSSSSSIGARETTGVGPRPASRKPGSPVAGSVAAAAGDSADAEAVGEVTGRKRHARLSSSSSNDGSSSSGGVAFSASTTSASSAGGLPVGTGGAAPAPASDKKRAGRPKSGSRPTATGNGSKSSALPAGARRSKEVLPGMQVVRESWVCVHQEQAGGEARVYVGDVPMDGARWGGMVAAGTVLPVAITVEGLSFARCPDVRGPWHNYHVRVAGGWDPLVEQCDANKVTLLEQLPSSSNSTGSSDGGDGSSGDSGSVAGGGGSSAAAGDGSSGDAQYKWPQRTSYNVAGLDGLLLWLADPCQEVVRAHMLNAAAFYMRQEAAAVVDDPPAVEGSEEEAGAAPRRKARTAKLHNKVYQRLRDNWGKDVLDSMGITCTAVKAVLAVQPALLPDGGGYMNGPAEQVSGTRAVRMENHFRAELDEALTWQRERDVREDAAAAAAITAVTATTSGAAGAGAAPAGGRSGRRAAAAGDTGSAGAEGPVRGSSRRSASSAGQPKVRAAAKAAVVEGPAWAGGSSAVPAPATAKLKQPAAAAAAKGVAGSASKAPATPTALAAADAATTAAALPTPPHAGAKGTGGMPPSAAPAPAPAPVPASGPAAPVPRTPLLRAGGPRGRRRSPSRVVSPAPRTPSPDPDDAGADGPDFYDRMEEHLTRRALALGPRASVVQPYPQVPQQLQLQQLQQSSSMGPAGALQDGRGVGGGGGVGAGVSVGGGGDAQMVVAAVPPPTPPSRAAPPAATPPPAVRQSVGAAAAAAGGAGTVQAGHAGQPRPVSDGPGAGSGPGGGGGGGGGAVAAGPRTRPPRRFSTAGAAVTPKGEGAKAARTTPQ